MRGEERKAHVPTDRDHGGEVMVHPKPPAIRATYNMEKQAVLPTMLKGGERVGTRQICILASNLFHNIISLDHLPLPPHYKFSHGRRKVGGQKGGNKSNEIMSSYHDSVCKHSYK